MKHAYVTTCDCKRCIKEKARRKLQAANDSRNKPKRHRPQRRYASKAEQYGRYLDCGPSAWDDR